MVHYRGNGASGNGGLRQGQAGLQAVQAHPPKSTEPDPHRQGGGGGGVSRSRGGETAEGRRDAVHARRGAMHTRPSGRRRGECRQGVETWPAGRPHHRRLAQRAGRHPKAAADPAPARAARQNTGARADDRQPQRQQRDRLAAHRHPRHRASGGQHSPADARRKSFRRGANQARARLRGQGGLERAQAEDAVRLHRHHRRPQKPRNGAAVYDVQQERRGREVPPGLRRRRRICAAA